MIPNEIIDNTKVKGLDNSNADNKITGRTDRAETDAIFHISFTGYVSRKLDSIVARDLFMTSIVDIQVTKTVENGIPNSLLSHSRVVNNQ